MIVAGKLAAEITTLGVPTCGGVRPKEEYSPAEMKVESHKKTRQTSGSSKNQPW